MRHRKLRMEHAMLDWCMTPRVPETITLHTLTQEPVYAKIDYLTREINGDRVLASRNFLAVVNRPALGPELPWFFGV